MKKVRGSALFLICILLLSLCSAPVYAAVPKLSVEAKAALLVDGDTGEVLYQYNADERL